MTCGSCGRANREGARFCDGCGKPLAPRCPACGVESRPDAQFCDGCGAPLAARRADDAVARKVVTIVFADLIGSTSLHERLDAESARRLMDRYYRALGIAVDAHGGTVVKLLGDGVMAAFGVPRVAEDDAIRAVRAAVGMQRAFRDLVQGEAGMRDLGLRVAVNTGEVVVSADNTDVVGDPVNVAARLQQAAHDGDVLVGESTRRLVGELVTLAPAGALALKGRAEAVTAYRVTSLERPTGASATPFVGRDDELRRITAVYDAAVAGRRARLAVVLGSPGLGKSRLVDEFARRLGDRASVLTARCDAAGGATFAPVAGALRAFLGLDDGTAGDALRAAVEAALPGDEGERGRIAEGITALLAGTPAPPEETFFVVRRLLARLATARPLVLAIDDLQWAEPLLLDLTEHLAQWGTDVPLLVLAAARPELRDARASLTVPVGLVSDVVTLAGLDAAAATRLAANVIGAEQLPAAIAGRVLATSEGNPLFLGELVRMLVQDGALRREGDRWTAGVELAALEMPPTIHALLAARIERLPPEERAVLERAAIVGRQFSRAAVAHLLPREVADLDARLEALRRSELIEPDTGWFLGEPLLRFHHVLIRDAAYRRLLKGTRAELHGRFADWLEGRVGGAVEHEETIGWHLEQAHQHLRELGPVDASGRTLGERAARYLAAAGRRALGRDDLPLAASLLGRALDRVDGDDPARADLALDWCEALLAAGDVGPAARALEELARFTGGSDRLRAWHTAFVGQRAVLTDPQALRATVDAVAAAATDLASAGDAAGEAKAHFVHAMALARLGKIGACEAALDRALAAARRARDRRRANAVLAGAPLAALWGPSPVTRASGRCLDVVRVLRITQGTPAVEAVALRCQAVLEALRGRTEAARRMVASSRQMVEELGITQRLLEADVFAGHIELLDGDAVAAERWLGTAYEGLRDHGLGIDAAQAAALLGRALLAQGRAAEAEARSHESEALAGDDLKAAIAWRGVRAEALARRGEAASAVDLARAAVDIAAATDALLDHADARRALATALRAAGRGSEADAEELRAIELWEAKGATLLAERARREAGYAAPEAHGPAAEAPSIRRPVRANAASTNAARLDAAVAARDLDATLALFAEGAETVHHPTGTAYPEHDSRRSWQIMFEAENLRFGHEMLATLGDSLGLCRAHISITAGGALAGPATQTGATDFEWIILMEVNGRGQRRLTELFAPDRLGDAVVRLYELHAEHAPGGPTRDRAAATARAIAAFVEPLRADAIAAIIAPGVEFVDHRTIGLGVARGAEQFRRGIRALLDAADEIATRVDDVLGLREDALLVRWTNFGTERAGGGAFERRFLMLWALGDDGRVTHMEEFDLDRDAEALARFDELTAEVPAARFANAVARAQAVRERRWGERDWDGVVASFVPTPRIEDRRALVNLDLEAEDFFTNMRMLFATASSRWPSELLATRGERLALLRVRFTGEIGDGGPFEVEHLAIVEHDASGLTAGLVLFDPGALDAAYDELDRRYRRGEGAPWAELLDHAEAFRRAVLARDRDALGRLLPNDFTLLSHRRFASTGSRMSRDEYIASLLFLDDLGVTSDLRLDHLRLSTAAGFGVATWHGTRDGGPFEASLVSVYPHDGRQFHSWELYDLDQVDAAQARFAELSRAPLSSESIADGSAQAALTRAFARAFAARDWDALAAVLAPDLVVNDHRLLGWETLRGPAAYIDALRSLVELAPDTRLRVDHVSLSGRAALYFTTWIGTRDGGAFEAPSAIVCELDESNQIRRFDQYDLGQLDEARARFAALRADPLSIPANAATRVSARHQAALEAGDMDAVARLCAPTMVFDDRRRGVRLTGDRETFIASSRRIASSGTLRLSRTLLGTSGDRLALHHLRWTAAPDGGAIELENLSVIEVDAEERIVAIVAFDPDDHRAASAEIRERFFQSDAGRSISASARDVARALHDHDLDRLRAALPDDFFMHDHRRTGLGLLEGKGAYLASAAALFEQTRDVNMENLYLVAAEPHGTLSVVRMFGTLAGGGPFESFFVRLTLNRGDRYVASELYEVEDLDAARARFEAWHREVTAPRPDPLHIPPNAATRAVDRRQEAAEAQDWAALEAQYAPTLVFDDRRRSVLLTGDRDTYLASNRHIFTRGTRMVRTVLATSGEHLVLEHVRWMGADNRAAFELETLNLTEVDAEGRIVAVVVFDPDDRRAASAELFERWIRSDAVRWMSPGLIEVVRALRTRDLARARAALPDPFTFHDHRRAGAGRLEGADEYIAWIAALFEQSPDAIIEPLYYLAAEPHGTLAVAHTVGTLSEGGRFESVFAQIVVPSVGAELYELEDLEVARARFEALRDRR